MEACRNMLQRSPRAGRFEQTSPLHRHTLDRKPYGLAFRVPAPRVLDEPPVGTNFDKPKPYTNTQCQKTSPCNVKAVCPRPRQGCAWHGCLRTEVCKHTCFGALNPAVLRAFFRDLKFWPNPQPESLKGKAFCLAHARSPSNPLNR